MKRIFALSAIAVLLVLGGVAFTAYQKLRITVPGVQPLGKLMWADQGWSDAQRLSFHHTAQGTRLIPYAWFRALEQPCLRLFGCELFMDKQYLSRFGFLPSQQDAELNPDTLPIGFALQNDFHDPIAQKTYPAVGLTCAACHTGALQYGGYTVVVDGAPAMIEVTQFQKALGVAMAFTQYLPFRYKRFESRVLGPNATDAEKKDLKDSFHAFMKLAKAEKDATEEQKIYANEAGFVRTDALARIGNQVFAVDMQNNANFVKSNAPVRYPQIWDASWFTWVQYNSSIADPLIRNIGEALGVRAMAKLYGDNASAFENSVSVHGLKTLEDLLAGSAPFEGLHSPQWPAVFPPIDAKKAEQGAHLYQQHCQGCHLPPVPNLLADLHSEQPAYWWKNKQGKQFLKVTDVPLEEIGTDPREAEDFKARTADSGALNQGRLSAANGLDTVTKGIANNFFQKASFTPEQKLAYSGYRDPADLAVRALAVYKARPLNGIWAAAPYLHNGSVPNLYELLSPQAERSRSFWLGTKQFDPVKVGYNPSELKGGYLYKVENTGNSNQGHEFKDGPRGKGVIGPALSPEERWALVEYLKSLPGSGMNHKN